MKYLLTGEETARLQFREIESIRFEDWLLFFDKEGVARMVGLDEDHARIDQCRAWFSREYKRIEEGRGGLNAILEKDTGKLVGQVGLKVQVVDDKEELEIAYSLLPGYW